MSETAPSLDWIVSVDDHVVEPPGVWLDRLPKKYHDIAPRVVEEDGRELWLYEDARMANGGLGAIAGRKKEEFTVEGFPYSEMRPGCYDPVARLQDMDEAGVIASLNFPTVPRGCGQIFWEAKDKDLAMLCVRAYNDWMIDEWCATASGRYIPLTIIPLWDPAAAAKEIERTAAKGGRTIAFSENFEPLGLPTINDPSNYWDPVLAAVQDCEQVISIHIGSSSSMYKVADDSPFIANMALGFIRPAGCMLSWIFGGVFLRFPELKIALSEGSIGWIPWALERAQQVHETQGHWVARGELHPLLPVVDHLQDQVEAPPVAAGRAPAAAEGQDAMWQIDTYRDYREHFYGCFIDDMTGLRMLDIVGEDNVMLEMDYPHSDSSWPNTLTMSKSRLDAAGLSPEVQYKLMRGNAERLYRFTASM
jgi:predicted TIM-barrel fold metal-dependent hydrolase